MTAKQLTDSILQLAIQGKLVPQDSSDEPASILLDRIREEKRRLVKGGVLKKKDLEETSIDEVPYIIPESWTWVRLENITTYISRGKSPVYSGTKKYPVVAQKCNQWSGFSLEKAKFIDPKTVDKYTEERILQDGDLLWNSTGLGTLGRMAIYDSSVNEYGWAVADSHVTVIRTRPDFAYYKYLYYYFASPEVQRVIEDKSDGSTKQKELAQETVKKYEIPLPPLAEQHRIVERIEEILPFVKEYGEAYEEASKLDTELPDKLKKSILQEAIKGKLGTQDPNDEPASILLEHIREEKEKLVKEGVLKKKDLEVTPVDEEEEPFRIPESWEWCRMEYIISLLSGRDLAPEEYNDKNVGIPYITGASNFTESGLLINRWTPKPVSISHLNDLLITCKGTIGTMAFNNIGDVHIARQVMAISSPYVDMQFVMYFLMNIVFILQKNAKSMIPGISREDILRALVPLPPLAEQHRIVQRIEDLYSEIDNMTINNNNETEIEETEE